MNIDIFSCSTRLKSLKAVAALGRVFGAGDVSIQEIHRAVGPGRRATGAASFWRGVAVSLGLFGLLRLPWNAGIWCGRLAPRRAAWRWRSSRTPAARRSHAGLQRRRCGRAVPGGLLAYPVPWRSA